jgi:hypothetical protein
MVGAGKHSLLEGHVLNKAEILFPKIEDAVIEKEVNSLALPAGECGGAEG